MFIFNYVYAQDYIHYVTHNRQEQYGKIHTCFLKRKHIYMCVYIYIYIYIWCVV